MVPVVPSYLLAWRMQSSVIGSIKGTLCFRITVLWATSAALHCQQVNAAQALTDSLR
jgi:hypothetical protein